MNKDKIIYRRNKLIELQKTGEVVENTLLYYTINENISSINYMIYQLDQLTNNWNELEEFIQKELDNIDGMKSLSGYQCKIILDKMKEIKIVISSL